MLVKLAALSCGQFHQHVYADHKSTVKSSVSFCAFGICSSKSLVKSTPGAEGNFMCQSFLIFVPTKPAKGSNVI